MKVSVRSVPTSFRRIGRGFTQGPTVIEVTKEEYNVLKAEQMLVVEDIVEAPAEAEKKEKGKK